MTRPQRIQHHEFDRALLEARERLMRHALRRTRNRPDAEDLVQSTLVRALAARQRFAAGSNLIAWLYSIQRNLFVDQVRGMRLTVSLEGAEARLPVVRPELREERRPGEVVGESELRRVVQGLREPFRTSFESFYFERRCYREMAEATHTQRTTIGVRLFRARKALAKRLRPTLVISIQDVQLHAQVW